ncbi:hypothetical protein LEP1GSC127_5156 [Leptospira kirschneri str. 200801925]|nr:hypothetical protein LEP1GSC127_5156 [Leptospira kirschneri str. 200801925]
MKIRKIASIVHFNSIQRDQELIFQQLYLLFLKFVCHNVSSSSSLFDKCKSRLFKHGNKTHKSITRRFFSTGYASIYLAPFFSHNLLHSL